MMPGMNPRQMQAMMRKMGIQQVDIPAVQVIIKTEDKELVFENPQVAKVNMMGQETYQVIGSPVERALDSTPDITDEDVQTVVEQTGVSEDAARKALEEHNGDIAETILALKE